MGILIVLLLVTARCALAQPSPPSYTDDYNKNPYAGNFNAATAILIVATVSAFFFLAFFSVYFRRCSRDRSATVLPALAGSVTASRRGVARGGRGLDPAVIETFPTLTYAAAKGLKVGGGKKEEEEALECAVCLSEFAGDDETLRMLPKCCHVFHPECIDTWLESHVTCPVCRADLSVVESAAAEAEAGESEERGTCTDGGEVAIDVSRISRSHSLGHVTRGSDRFTLRLQEHVRREIVAAGRLRRSASVAVFRGGGEGSMRRGYRAMSERWTSGILATWRRSSAEAAAEGSSVRGGGGGGGGGAMFNCLGGGGEESHDKGESSNVSVLARV